MDAAIILLDERTIRVVRQGLTSDRTAFAKRMRRLREDMSSASAVLILTPDEVRLRQTLRLTAGTPTVLALEKEAVLRGPGDPIWHPPSINASLDLDNPGQELLPGHLLPALLKPSEKRALDALSDWPWITLKHLAGLLGVSAPRTSQLIIRLECLGLATRVGPRRQRLALTSKGLSLLARRRWSADSLDPEGPSEWRNISGGRSRQLLRNIEHTEAVHRFVTALARQAHALGWELLQIAPPRQASGIFATESGSTRSTPTLTAQSGVPMRRGPSSWNGSAEPCAPQP